MEILHLLCVALVAGAAVAKPSNLEEPSNTGSLNIYTTVYKGSDLSGDSHTITEYVANMAGTGFDNDIQSVHQTGMWVFYENSNYNTESGSVYFVHGVELTVTFPPKYQNIMSSMRYAGDHNNPNGDTWTLFQGQYFTGNEYYGVEDSATLGYMDSDGSSLILTGESPWTIYSGQQFSGDQLCVYPNTDHDVGPQGNYLDFGLYPDVTSLGITDNSIRSVRKGCWGEKIAKPAEMKYEGKAKNGAWGYVKL